MLNLHPDSFPGAAEIVPALQQISLDRGVTFTLLGAGARNLWLSGYQRGNPAATKDADFAVFATDMQAYQSLKDHLVAAAGFSDSPRLPLSMLSSQGVQVDFLPYGPIAPDDEVPLPGFERAAQVQGLAEACAHAISMSYQGKPAGKVVSLPGLVLLKLISLDDRPTQRARDAEDIALVLKHAYDRLEDQLFEQHYDLLDIYEADNHYPIQVGSHLIGRQIQAISQANAKLTNRLTHIIPSHLRAHPQGALSRALIHQQGLSATGAQLSLAALQRGMEE